MAWHCTAFRPGVGSDPFTSKCDLEQVNIWVYMVTRPQGDIYAIGVLFLSLICGPQCILTSSKRWEEARVFLRFTVRSRAWGGWVVWIPLSRELQRQTDIDKNGHTLAKREIMHISRRRNNEQTERCCFPLRTLCPLAPGFLKSLVKGSTVTVRERRSNFSYVSIYAS